MATLKMGTRGSPLALAQSGAAARQLEKLNPGLTVETVVIKTSGDLFGAPSPEVAKTLPQGAKGLWIKELEEALLDGRVDFAAHSCKDLPALLAAGLSIAAYPEREDPRDVFVATAPDAERREARHCADAAARQRGHAPAQAGGGRVRRDGHRDRRP